MTVREISEKTLIPVSLVVSLLGATAWLTAIHIETRAQAEQLVTLQRTVDDYSKVMGSIDTRLARIEGRLGVVKGH